MNNNELKIKYRNLYYNVSNINNRLNNVIYKVNELNDFLEDNAIIDEQIIEKTAYDETKNKLNNVSYELNYYVIPSLRNNAFK